jgi:hypothetical protein
MNEEKDPKPKAIAPDEKVSPQVLHDRAKNAANEMHKLLLSFAAATLGIYFIALTKELPQITKLQILSCLAGILMMGIALFSGVLGLFADMKRYYFWGCAKQERNQKNRDELYQERDRWLTRQRLSRPVLFVFFSLGIVASIIFMVLRIMKI